MLTYYLFGFESRDPMFINQLDKFLIEIIWQGLFKIGLQDHDKARPNEKWAEPIREVRFH